MEPTLSSSPSHLAASTRYWARSRTPLASLIFLLPLIALYELGTLFFATDPVSGATHYVYARSILRDVFELMGVTGYYLPGLIVVVVLVCWHIARRDPWRWEWRVYGGMAAESLLLAMPPFVFMLLMMRQPTPAALQALEEASPGGGWQAQLIFSLGAGIYEELLFRLILIALLHLIAVDLLQLPELWGATLAIIFSAVAFALYHFSETNQFQLNLFAFYTLAGLYLAAVYVARGFGVVAGTHAMYDVLVVALQFLVLSPD